MTIHRNHYVLAVHSIAASSDFYTRALGFEEVFNDGNWSFVRRDCCTIMLGECRDAMPADDLGDHSYFAYLVVDNADSFYSRCQAQKVEIEGRQLFGRHGIHGCRAGDVVAFNVYGQLAHQ